jgi:hypothetical protein
VWQGGLPTNLCHLPSLGWLAPSTRRYGGQHGSYHLGCERFQSSLRFSPALLRSPQTPSEKSWLSTAPQCFPHCKTWIPSYNDQGHEFQLSMGSATDVPLSQRPCRCQRHTYLSYASLSQAAAALPTQKCSWVGFFWPVVGWLSATTEKLGKGQLHVGVQVF